MAAQFLTVSPDTVYSLFQSGELPGRKVGRKWVTTKAAVLRWVESSATDDALARAVQRGDHGALAEAINRGKARVKGSRSR
jgi:excisionase family DNA binding protein